MTLHCSHRPIILTKTKAAQTSRHQQTLPSRRNNTNAAPNIPAAAAFFASPEALCRAIQQGDREGVQALMASCSDSMELLAPVQTLHDTTLTARWKNYWGISALERRTTALHWAVETAGETSLAILRLLLRALPRGAVDGVGLINIVHAMNTSSSGARQFVLALDHVGGNMQRCTVLTWAAILDNMDAVNELIRVGADINTRMNWLSVTPLMAHCMLGKDTSSDGMTLLLLAGGAELDLRDGLGNTALHLALFTRKSGIAMRLLNAGASVDLPNNEGVRACDVASTAPGLSREVRATIAARSLRGYGYGY